MDAQIQFRYLEGNINRSEIGNDTGWRVLPYVVFTHNQHSRLLCEMAVESGGAVQRVSEIIGSGEAALVPAGVEHRFSILGPGTQRSTWCHLYYTVFDTIDLFSFYDIPWHWSGQSAATLRRLCARMLRLRKRERSGPVSLLLQAQLQMAGMAFVTELLRRSTPNPDRHDDMADLARLEPVLQFIQSRLGEPLTLPELADQVYMSRSRFAELFNRVVGLPPMQYVKRLRLERAQMMLISTATPVGEIGQQCGFPDPFHFSRTFKSSLGMSPRHFREQHAAARRDGSWY